MFSFITAQFSSKDTKQIFLLKITHFCKFIDNYGNRVVDMSLSQLNGVICFVSKTTHFCKFNDNYRNRVDLYR